MRRCVAAGASVLIVSTGTWRYKSNTLRLVRNGETCCEACGVHIRSGTFRIGIAFCDDCTTKSFDSFRKNTEKNQEKNPEDACPSCHRESCDCILFSNERLNDRLLQNLRESIKICFGVSIPSLYDDDKQHEGGIPVRLVPHKGNRQNESDGTTTAHTLMRYSRRFQFFPPRTFLKLDRIDEICITENLEIGHAMKIIVHELFHVWLRQCQDVHDLKEEEAFCEMMAYLWLAEIHALKVSNNEEQTLCLNPELLSQISIHSVRTQLDFVEKRRNGTYGSSMIEKWIEVARRKTLQGLLENIEESDRIVRTLQREDCVITFQEDVG